MLLVGAASNSGGGGYKLENSLRFRASADAYLSRANGSTATLATSGTISMWVKKCRNGSREYLMQTGSGTGNSNHFSLFFTNSTADSIKVGQYSVNAYINSTTLYRDSSAWYHLVMAFDSTESTGTDRVKIYVNGELTTNTSSAGASSNFAMTNNGQTIYIGRESGYPSDTYMSEVQLIDGQTLAATNFGETDDNGTWIPKEYTGSYGNNGFYLKFDDTSSVAALGTDSSGNGNNFTPTNISLTAGVTYDSMTDVPTLTDEDTSNFATRNPLAYSPSMTFSNGNLTTNGTLASWYGSASTIFVNSGKWYWETTITVKGTYIQIGAAEEDWLPNSSVGLQSNAYGYYSYNGNAVRDGASTAYGTTYTTGDVIGVALDYDSGAIWFSKNGTWQNSATISEVQAGTTTNAAFTGVTARLSPASSQYGTATHNHNFGQQPFAYTQPTGFLKLNTFNLPDSTIEDGSTNFNPVLYTGNGSSQSIIGVGFQPDWTWIKGRSAATAHALYDAVRGVQKDLVSDSTAAETTQTTGLTAFNSNGFTTGVLAKLNTNSATYVAWNWKAASTAAATYVVKVVSDSGNKYRFDDFGTSAVTLNLHETGTYTFDQSDSSNSGHPLRFSATSDGTHGGGSEYTTGVTVTGTPGSAGAKTVIVVAASAPTLYYYCSVHSGMGGQANTNVTKGSSNFDGTIVSTVSANPTAGFSIATYVGNGVSGATFGHGLGVAPELVMVKDLDTAVNWVVYSKPVGNTKTLYLNLGNAQTSVATWANTTPTASVVSVGTNGLYNNGTTKNHIAYCFASVEGYSKIGSYIGNGNVNGPFIYTGFKPAFIMTKCASSAGEWEMYDTSRGLYNAVTMTLEAQSTTAELNFYTIDILSNGFKQRNFYSTQNQSGATFIYMAFAENPFKNSNAR
tara:strand:- start:235 stop:2949 length:2715 start_codon:yes stop_codon:yes gene_type:complete